VRFWSPHPIYSKWQDGNVRCCCLLTAYGLTTILFFNTVSMASSGFWLPRICIINTILKTFPPLVTFFNKLHVATVQKNWNSYAVTDYFHSDSGRAIIFLCILTSLPDRFFSNVLFHSDKCFKIDSQGAQKQNGEESQAQKVCNMLQIKPQ